MSLFLFLAPQYLDRIGQLFFGVPPKQSPSYGGLLGEQVLLFHEGTFWCLCIIGYISASYFSHNAKITSLWLS